MIGKYDEEKGGSLISFSLQPPSPKKKKKITANLSFSLSLLLSPPPPPLTIYRDTFTSSSSFFLSSFDFAGFEVHLETPFFPPLLPLLSHIMYSMYSIRVEDVELGMRVVFGGDTIHRVVNITRGKAGKVGRPRILFRAKNVFTGKIDEKLCRVGDTVGIAYEVREEMHFLDIDTTLGTVSALDADNSERTLPVPKEAAFVEQLLTALRQGDAPTLDVLTVFDTTIIERIWPEEEEP